jgi:hypothetical protein
MNWSLDYRGVLMRLEHRYTFHEAASCSRLSRQAVWKHMKRSQEFREAVLAVREAGRKLREYRVWVRHPFRGLRPPTGKGHGGLPRFRYGYCPR